MTPAVTAICRHPVKSLGEELVGAARLAPGQPLPWDRIWAVCHGQSTYDASGAWDIPRQFVNQTFVPQLAQISLRFDEDAGVLYLEHPDAEPLSVDPDREGEALCHWLLPLGQDARPGPYSMARISEGAFTDFEDTHISIASEASRRALGEIAGQPLERVRFRMNIWLDGFAPWEELDWVGREITIGDARLKITERDKRCNATTASPVTGARDVQVPAILRKRFGHMDFGVYAQVIEGGEVKTGDPARI
ncbi:MAG: MOSC domain-containing protein [Pseudomonadota bacterium]